MKRHVRVADPQSRIQDGARRKINLRHVFRHLQHAVFPFGVQPPRNEHHARCARRRNLLRLLGRVGEDGENRLVVVVQLDAEIAGLGQRHREDAVVKGVPKPLPRRKHLVAPHVLAHGDVHRDGTARKGELAKASVDVAAARPAGQHGLLAVVPDDKVAPRLALAHAHRIRTVPLNRRRIVRIAHEGIRRPCVNGQRCRTKAKNPTRHLHFSPSNKPCWRKSAEISGSRPRKSRKTSIADFDPPSANTVSR